jgi:hypothetical protein
VVLADGRAPRVVRELATSQRLRADTLTARKGIGAVLTRDAVVIADVEAGSLSRRAVGAFAERLRIRDGLVEVATREGVLRFDPRGRPA